MKKVFGTIIIAFGTVMSGIGLFSLINIKSEAASSIAIIGGADGPTSVFVAGKVGQPLYVAMIGGVVIIVIGIILLIIKKR